MLGCVRWYVRYALSDRDVEALMRECGLAVDHTTIFRWVQRYAPERDQRCWPRLNATNDSYHVDETDMKIKRQWYDLCRAVDSTGATLDAGHTTPPRVITVDKNAAYPPVFDALQREGPLPEICQLRAWKYLNNMIEPDHRCGKRCVNPGLGFGAFATTPRIIQGDAAVHRLRKGQLEGITMRDVLAQNGVINRLFGVAASGVYPEGRAPVAVIFATHSGPWNRGLSFGETAGMIRGEREDTVCHKPGSGSAR